MLSDAELDVILPLTYPLPPAVRESFLAAVSSALNGTSTVGPGLAYRTARELLPKFFTPPELGPTNGPHHHGHTRRPA
jgi:hypothetical protein